MVYREVLDGPVAAAILRTESDCTEPQLLHTDVEYLKEVGPNALICLIALEDNTVLRVVPASHRYQSAQHLRTETVCQRTGGTTLRSKLVNLPKTNACFMHPLLYHSGWCGGLNNRFHCAFVKNDQLKNTYPLINVKKKSDVQFFRYIDEHLSIQCNSDDSDDDNTPSDKDQFQSLEDVARVRSLAEARPSEATDNPAAKVAQLLYDNFIGTQEIQMKIIKDILIPFFYENSCRPDIDAELFFKGF